MKVPNFNSLVVCMLALLFVAVCADSALGAGSVAIRVPNGQQYPNNGSTVITSFSVNQNCTANFVVIQCLDDRNNPNSEAATETFEVALTSDAAGNNVLGGGTAIRQVEDDFGCIFGNIDQRRYLFDIADVALTANTTYYLRTKVIAGAPVALWGNVTLYFDGGIPGSRNIKVPLTNGQTYNNNGNTVITAFKLTEAVIARYVMLDCLDDNRSPDTEAATETFEVSITSDAAGNTVIGSAQRIKTDFGCVYGNIDRRRHIFDTGDVTLNANTTYYMKTTAIAGAPIRFWGAARLYYWQVENYLKIAPPPDVDKDGVTSPDNSCWLATASNMLAGAGYGTGTNLQARADDIYADLVAWQTTAANPTGKAIGGWIDTALSWWLSSANNTWATNPYDLVTLYGNKSRTPWLNANGARFMGNELRRCQMLGLSISWPRTTAGGLPADRGHAITCWGDSSSGANLTANPAQVRVTDSDRDTGGNVQTYTYDAYTNPNPAGFNEGNGWYIDFNTNHPFIKHIVTLCPAGDVTGDGSGSTRSSAQKAVGSYRIHQSDQTASATDLHYRIKTNSDILSYNTEIDWTTSLDPDVQRSTSPPQELTVDWDLTDNPIPYCTYVTINTDLILSENSGMEYQNVYFTYPDPGTDLPGFSWNMSSTILSQTDVNDITGGYVIGSFDLFSGQDLLGEYRFVHQYDYTQDPESHDFTMENTEAGYYEVSNFRFGHSYGMLDPNSLWEFEDWMTYESDPQPIGSGNPPVEIQLDWQGLLPYPESGTYVEEEQEPECTTYLPEDLNYDCYVDVEDFAKIATVWLQNTVP